MKKIIFFLTALLTLSACAGSGTTGNADEYGRGSISIGVMLALDSFPILLAEELGFFEEEDIDVDIQIFANATERDIAFQTSDDMDGLMLDFVSFANFREAGVEIMAVSNINGLSAIVGGVDYYTMEDLQGQNVLIAFNSAMHYILHTALVQAGISPGDVTMEAVPSLPTRMEMLINRQAAGAALPEPFISLSLNQGLNIIATTRDLDINPFALGFRREVTEQKTSDLRAFYSAINRAVDHINTSPREDIIDYLIDLAGFPEPLRASMEIPEMAKFITPNHRHVDSVFDFARYHGLLTIPLTSQDVIFDLLES